MTKARISALTLCVLLLSPLVAAKAQNMGTDPQPINPNGPPTGTQSTSSTVISTLISVVLALD